MARGFESKSVESQQADRFERGSSSERPSREELERRGKRESLELSRRRIEKELAASSSAVHRAALENALRFLDDELSKI
jgi:hypothetical protein